MQRRRIEFVVLPHARKSNRYLALASYTIFALDRLRLKKNSSGTEELCDQHSCGWELDRPRWRQPSRSLHTRGSLDPVTSGESAHASLKLRFPAHNSTAHQFGSGQYRRHRPLSKRRLRNTRNQSDSDQAPSVAPILDTAPRCR